MGVAGLSPRGFASPRFADGAREFGRGTVAELSAGSAVDRGSIPAGVARSLMPTAAPLASWDENLCLNLAYRGSFLQPRRCWARAGAHHPISTGEAGPGGGELGGRRRLGRPRGRGVHVPIKSPRKQTSRLESPENALSSHGASCVEAENTARGKACHVVIPRERGPGARGKVWLTIPVTSPTRKPKA